MDRDAKLRIIRDDSIRALDLVKGGDKMAVKVTEDGRYRADITGSISSVNHGSADSFLKDIARTLGGLLKITRQGKAHAHTHTHDGHTHTH
jgi:hypothetical protein